MRTKSLACLSSALWALSVFASAAFAQSPERLHGSPTPVFEPPETNQSAAVRLHVPGKVPALGPSTVVGGSWTWLGPAPTVNAQLTVPPSNKVAGCIQAIAAHPTNPDILYIGAVNGGVWRTTNATALDPTWTPLTDTLPSLAIGALEFDSTDASRQTLIAGSARLSSFAARGGVRIGVLYSINGGNSWSVFGTAQFVDENLTSVAARGNVLMACSDSTWAGGNGSGLFRSTNTGGSFQLISGAGGTGLPATSVSDLVGDPGNLSRFYAAVRTSGIFRSDNTGATWTNVTGGITGITASTTKIEMAVHNSGGNNAVYVAVLNSGALASVWRSTNFGGFWTQMDTPAANPGAQGNIHFSIVADPADPAIVYVGGDSGTHLYRGNASLAPSSQFTSIQGANAGNTTPHADSREMVFDANGNIIQGDDGGIYRRSSPQSSAGIWTSVVGDLGVIEAHSVTYDSVTHTAMIGTQDNGTHIMPSTNSLVWTWISGGDGGDVVIDDRTLPGKSIRYGSSQNLAGFYRRTFDASNSLLTNSSPALTLLGGSPAITGQFVTPVELNKVDPARIVIGGGNSVYESLDRGNSVTALSVGFGVNRVALAYGGWLAGVPNPDVICYGSGTTVRLRTTSGGAVTATAGTFPGGTVRDVVLNSNDWRQIFAMDNAAVYASTNSGTNWINITGNLTDVGEMRALEFFRFGATDCVAAGTDAGVFVSFLDNLGFWSQLGTGLPHTPAFDLVANPQDRVLVVGTLGRGVYRLNFKAGPLIATNSALLLTESCSVSNLVIDPGESVTVALALRNLGDASVTNLVATLLATGGVTFPSGPQSYGLLAVGGPPVTNTYAFTANGPCGGTIEAVLQLQDGTNNLGSVSFLLASATNCCLNPASADVRVSVTDAPDPVSAGSNITYTIVVTNAGPASATDVVITNTLPFGTVFISATPSQGTTANIGGTIVGNIGTLASGGSATLVIIVNTTTGGQFVDRIHVSATQSDYDFSNNSALAITTVLLPALSISDASILEGNSGTTNAVFIVSLSRSYNQTVTVQYDTINQTALADSDYFATNGFITFAPGQTNQSITVMIKGDLFYELSETFLVNLSNPTNAAFGDSQGLGTIVNDDPLPTAAIGDATVVEGNSGTTNAVFTVMLSAASGRTATLTYSTANGSAASGSDYVAASFLSLNFAPGETNKTITILVNGDIGIESNETFFVNLVGGADATITDGQGMGTILDDDGLPGQLHHFSWSAIPSPELVSAPFSVTITAQDAFNATVSNFTGTAALSGTVPGGGASVLITEIDPQTPDFIEFMNVSAASLDISGWQITVYDSDTYPNPLINYVVPAGVAVPSGELFRLIESGTSPGAYPSFFAGTNIDWTASTTVPIAVLLRNATGALIDFACVGSAVSTAISNPISIPTNHWVGNSIPATTSSSLNYQRAGNQDHNNNTDWATGSPTPGQTNNGLITPFAGGEIAVEISPTNSGNFVAGIWNGSLTVLQTATNMALRAADASGHTGSSNPFDTLFANDIFITVVDSPDPVAVGANLTYTVVITNTGPSTATGLSVTNVLPASVTFVSAAPSQGTCSESGGVVTCMLGVIAGGTNATIAIVVVPNVGALSITNLATVTRAEPDASSLNNVATALTTVALPAFSIADAGVMEGNAGVTNALFLVSLSPVSTQTTSVSYATANLSATAGSDYLVTNGTLIFAPGVTNSIIAVLILSDATHESNELFFVNLANSTNATLADNRGVGTIINDDAPPAISINDTAAAEGNMGTVNAVFTASLSAASGLNVMVNYSTANGTATAGVDYVGIAGGVLIFNPGETNKTITVLVNGDLLIESNETFLVNLTSAANATLADSQGAGTIVDDDTPTPGEVHHFVWGKISSSQVSGGPIPVTIFAEDFLNNPASNFSGLVNFTAQRETFRVDFESGLQGFAISNNFGVGAGLWHFSTGRGSQSGHSATHSLYYGTNETASGGGNYNLGRTEGAVISPTVDLGAVAAPITLSFNYVLQKEGNTNYDRATIEVSTNNFTNFTIIAGSSISIGQLGTNVGWTPATANLSSFAGRQVRLRLHFDTVDAAVNNFEGWYMDDVAVASGISIFPAISGNFVNGVWSGVVNVLQAGSNIVLRADDSLGHFGQSLAFNVADRPRLAIGLSGNLVVLSWPISANGFLPEQTSPLSFSNSWLSVTNRPVTNLDQNVISNIVPLSNAVYRLQKP